MPSSRRVLFFVETPHRVAGAQRSLLAALGRMGAHGIEPQVIFPGDGACVEAYRAAHIPTRVVPGPPALTMFNRRFNRLGVVERAALGMTQFLPYAKALARLIREEKYDVVHFNTPRGILEGGVAAKLAGVPAVLHLRGAPVGFGHAYWLAAQALANAIVLVAHALKPHVTRLLHQRCAVVHNGVDVPPTLETSDARSELANRLGVASLTDPGTTLFVSLSSFTPFKGLHHLLEAAALLNRRNSRAQIVLAGVHGDQRYEEFLDRKRKQLGLENIVHFSEFVSDPMVLLAAADALVLPSVVRERLTLHDGTHIDVSGTEGLPRSILEAMAFGRPVIASRVQGVSEQLEDGASGIMVPPGDPAALADAMFRAETDRAWRATAGARGREIARERFSTDAAARGLAAVLHSV